jgi:hypothetical protein
LCESAAIPKQPHFASRLLWWSVMIGVPQMVPLAFVHSAHQAVVLAVPMGLMAAWAMRPSSILPCGRVHQVCKGTLMMLSVSAQMFAWRGSDVLGPGSMD